MCGPHEDSDVMFAPVMHLSFELDKAAVDIRYFCDANSVHIYCAASKIWWTIYLDPFEKLCESIMI